MRTTANGTRSPVFARLVGFGADRALLALGLPEALAGVLVMTVRLDTPVQAAVHPRASRLQTLGGLRGIGIQLDSRETPDALVALARAPRH